MYIGIDLGGTKIAAGVVKSGRVIQHIRIPTEPGKGKTHVLKSLRHAIDELSRDRKIKGIGIGVPGVFKGTKIVYLTNIPCLNGVDLKKALKKRVVLGNDAACFGLAESVYGCKSKNLVGITLGTGLGSCVIIDGKIHRGHHGFAGETCYATLNPEEYSMKKKQRDWDSVLSGEGFVKIYSRFSKEKLRPSEIWSSNSVTSRKTVETISRLFAVYLANICLVVDPEYIVVGGGASSARLVKETKKHLKHLLSEQKGFPKLVSAIVKHPGIVGAAEIARLSS